VPERERAQKRPERRGRRQPAPAAGACAAPQHTRVVDRVGAQQHRVDERHHLAARVRSARPVSPQPDQTPRQRLNSEPPRERRDQHHPGVRDDPLIVELDLHAVQSDRPVIVHHEGDLLGRGRDCPIQSLFACS
jgi:hypothetical protein